MYMKWAVEPFFFSMTCGIYAWHFYVPSWANHVVCIKPVLLSFRNHERLCFMVALRPSIMQRFIIIFQTPPTLHFSQVSLSLKTVRYRWLLVQVERLSFLASRFILTLTAFRKNTHSFLCHHLCELYNRSCKRWQAILCKT